LERDDLVVWAVCYKDFSAPNTSSTFTLHWDGAAWSEIPSPNVEEGNYLSGVDGPALNDVWALGQSGVGLNISHTVALHWDGAAWTVVPTPVLHNDAAFFALTALSSMNIVAVGQSSGVLLSERWDGTQWHVIPTPPVIDDYGFLWAIPGRDGSVWAAGYQGFGDLNDLFLQWTPSAD
jgi:hypothetical protein